MKNDPENVKLLNDGLVCSTNLGEILAPISQTKEHQDLFSTTVILKRKHPMNRRRKYPVHGMPMNTPYWTLDMKSR